MLERRNSDSTLPMGQSTFWNGALRVARRIILPTGLVLLTAGATAQKEDLSTPVSDLACFDTNPCASPLNEVLGLQCSVAALIGGPQCPRRQAATPAAVKATNAMVSTLSEKTLADQAATDKLLNSTIAQFAKDKKEMLARLEALEIKVKTLEGK